MIQRVVIAATVIFVVCLAGSASAGVSSAPVQDEVTGISVGPIQHSEFDMEEIDGLREDIPDQYDVGSEVTIVHGSDGTTYVVFSEESIPAGEVTIEGWTPPLADLGSGESVLIADESDVTTDGEQISYDEFETNASGYEYELVEVNATIQESSVVQRPIDGVETKIGAAALWEPGTEIDPPLDGPPGETTRWSSLNLSDNGLGNGDAEERLFPDAAPLAYSYGQQYWGSGPGTATVAVVPDEYVSPGDGESEVFDYRLILVDVEYESQKLDGLDELENRGEDLEGETVTVETDVVGSSVSTQRFLTSVVSCGGQTVWIPGTPVCVPLGHDTVAHSGVFVDNSTPLYNAVPYVAVSNSVQGSIVEPQQGRYEVTGEVVASNEIGASYSGLYGLLVHDMERVGDLTVTEDVQHEATSVVDAIENDVRSQINTSAAYEAGAVDADHPSVIGAGEYIDDDEETGGEGGSGGGPGENEGGGDNGPNDDTSGESDENSDGSSGGPSEEGEGGGGSADDSASEMERSQSTKFGYGGSGGLAPIFALTAALLSLGIIIIGFALEIFRGLKNEFSDGDANVSRDETAVVVVVGSLAFATVGFLSGGEGQQAVMVVAVPVCTAALFIYGVGSLYRIA